jgi:hypothetical protein
LRGSFKDGQVNTLTIEYVLEGVQRGYTITSSTQGLPDDVVKAIWRFAMPRGTGWSAYVGARSIKAFMLPDEQIAVSHVTVTDQTDETGRTGIRRAEVEILPPNGFERYLKTHLAMYPADIRAIARDRCAKLTRRLPKIKPDTSLILTYPYQSVDQWQVIEAAMMHLMLDPPRVWRSLKPPFPFTTLALDSRSENPLIALPIQQAGNLNTVQVGG